MENNKNFKNFDLIMTRNYVKPSKNKPNHFLSNTENSMKIFEKNKKDLFSFDYEMLSKTSNNKIEKYYITSKDISVKCNNNNYKECLLMGKAFEEILSFKIEIKKKTIKYTTNNDLDVKVETIALFNNEIRIPLYVGNNGLTPSCLNIFPEKLEIGGFFVTKNNIKKYAVFKQDRTYTFPKYDLLKLNTHHISFNSIPLKSSNKNRLTKPQFLTIDFNLNLNKITLNISSNKTLCFFNIIILIAFLTKLSIKEIKDIILSRFINEKEIYDQKIIDIFYILYYKTIDDLEKFKNDNEYNKTEVINEKKLIQIYIKKHFILKYKKNNYKNIFEDENDQINNDYSDMFLKNLLPSTNSLIQLLKENNDKKTSSQILFLKGMNLLCVLEDSLIAAFQSQIYIDKNHFSNRRIMSPGITIETICSEIINTLVGDYTQQLEKQHNNSNINFKAFRKTENVINKIFNMQDNKHSDIIKPQKNVNYAQKIIVNNSIVWQSSIKLTKFINIRDPNIVSMEYMGVSDTPDHGEKVGINRRFNIGAKLNDKDFETHKNLVLQVYYYIQKYIETHSKISFNDEKNNLNKIDDEIVNINLVDDSEIWIGCIEQSKIIDLYESILDKKRNFIFDSNLIDVALIPYYTQTKLKLFLPIKKFRKLRINIGNKIVFMPMYVVKDGKPVFQTTQFEETEKELKSMDFNDILKKYPNIIEFIGPEQFTYSNVCENVSIFMSLPEEKKKLYNYINFDNMLNLSIIECMIFDIGKMPGTRSIFSTSQLKNNISSIQTDSLNNIDSSKFTTSGFQEPCITNDMIIESRIPKQSFGTHVIIAFMTLNDNIEDSIIINKNSINNGLFVTISIALYKGQIDLKNLQSKQNILKLRNSYKKLDKDNIPKLNVVLEQNDALYGNAEAKLKKVNNVHYLQDNSIAYKFLIPGRVDRILLTTKNTFVNIRYTVAILHYLERGHKMSNQCAQKATVSKVSEPYELPYNIDGVRPDIIFNTLSKLGRKTINMFYQTIVTNYYNYIPYDKKTGKKKYINYKSFSDNNILTLQKYKKKIKAVYTNYEDEKINDIFNSEETLFNPYTGEMLYSKIFMGPIYYIRLSQISDEKISVRHRGKVNKSNQPPGGKGGAHRIGEMEIDLLATHGCSNMIYEITQDSLELQSYVMMCKICSNIATKINNERYTCLNCENMNMTPILEKHLMCKSSYILYNLLNFRSIKLNISYNKENNLYKSELSN